MNLVVTGTAGFIGAAVAERLLTRGDRVVGIDDCNDYYEVSLKHARLERLTRFDQFEDLRFDIADAARLNAAFAEHSPQRVVHLAAQAGVRYSLENPSAYVHSNLVAFANVLEACRANGVEHLVYASSSSVYGLNATMPFTVHANVDHPVSLYAATKKSNELLAHTYSHLYQIPTTGLRFFTVYGPWGRPDMSPFIFIRRILAGEPIDLFNYGRHKRDFTYIDDIVEGVVRTLDHPARGNDAWDARQPDPATSPAPWRIYNIGSNSPTELVRYVEIFEECLGMKAEKRLLPMQPGDIEHTYADVSALMNDIGYRPTTSIEDGIERFVRWYRSYYRV